jgi:alpha-L-fucosidase 2
MAMTRRTFLARTSAVAAISAESPKGMLGAGQKPPSSEKAAATGDFAGFLERHDPVWEVPAERWSQGLPLGNGDLGAVIWGTGNPLVITLDKTDIWEKRHWTPNPEHFKWREFRKLLETGTLRAGEKDFQRPPSPAVPKVNSGSPPIPYPTRLPVGRGELRPIGQVKSARMHLNLWTATAAGEVVTDRGQIQWKALVHSSEPLMIVEIEGSGEEEKAGFSALPFNNPKQGASQVVATLTAWGYPEPTTGTNGQASYWAQDMPTGGQYAVAWRDLAGAQGKRWILISIAFTPDARQAVARASQEVLRWQAEDIPKLVTSHQQWWAGYYPASFVSVPDTRLESLYWMEMYKLAAATRPDKPPITLQGCWSPDGVMPPWSDDYHWNINVEMTYWPIYTANRLAYGEPLYDMIDRARPGLRQFCRSFFEREGEFLCHATDIDCNPVYDWASGQLEFNGLPWMCHHYWLHWRYSQDRDFLRNRCLPLMKESVRVYLDELETKQDGLLHLPWGFSPEYSGRGRKTWGPDVTIDLALIRFLCTALREGHRALGINDAEMPRWEETLRKLTPYPLAPSGVGDETGIRGGLAVRADLPYETSHRHFSHLMALYPLKLLPSDSLQERPVSSRIVEIAPWDPQPPAKDANEELIEHSLRNWIYQGHGEWVGFSFCWGACLAAYVGRPELARTLLLDYTDRFTSENSFQLQGPLHGCDMSVHGTYALTLESGPGACAAMQEMLLQSQGGLLRVFPAAPPAWTEAAFDNLRAEGAFRVSAVRKDGRTQWVKIVSEVGGPCRLRTDLGDSDVKAWSAAGPKPFERQARVIVFDTQPGEEIWFGTPEVEDRPSVVPLAGRPDDFHFFGVKKIPRW